MRKAHERKARLQEVYVTEHRSRRASRDTPVITFVEADESGILHWHDDALLVTMLVANYTLQTILVGNDNSTDILLWDAFCHMGINDARLRLAPVSLNEFIGDIVQSMGFITMSVLAREHPISHPSWWI